MTPEQQRQEFAKALRSRIPAPAPHPVRDAWRPFRADYIREQQQGGIPMQTPSGATFRFRGQQR
jgi:hypothetical protein